MCQSFRGVSDHRKALVLDVSSARKMGEKAKAERGKEYEAIAKREKGGDSGKSTLLEDIQFLGIPFLLVIFLSFSFP